MSTSFTATVNTLSVSLRVHCEPLRLSDDAFRLIPVPITVLTHRFALPYLAHCTFYKVVRYTYLLNALVVEKSEYTLPQDSGGRVHIWTRTTKSGCGLNSKLRAGPTREELAYFNTCPSARLRPLDHTIPPAWIALPSLEGDRSADNFPLQGCYCRGQTCRGGSYRRAQARDGQSDQYRDADLVLYVHAGRDCWLTHWFMSTIAIRRPGAQPSPFRCRSANRSHDRDPVHLRTQYTMYPTVPLIVGLPTEILEYALLHLPGQDIVRIQLVRRLRSAYLTQVVDPVV